jgi:hypothetical protein
MRFVGFTTSFVGVFVLFAGIFVLLSGGGWDCASVGLALMTLGAVTNPPGFAFKDAHRLTKPVWLLIAAIGLIPPLGLASFVLWVVLGRAVERAWAVGDPASYRGYLARRAAAQASSQQTIANQQAYQKGRDEGRRGW